MRKAIFPGSFDPITNGHYDIIRRGISLFDEVIVAIGINVEKKYMFTLEERKKFIEDAFKDEPKVTVITYEGLTIDLCRKLDAEFILRGLRNPADFEFEKAIAHTNRRLSKIETNNEEILNLEEVQNLINELEIQDIVHFVEIDAGAFLDMSGNEFAGNSGSELWSFMTEIITGITNKNILKDGMLVHYAKDELTINFESNHENVKEIRVFDLQGKEQFSMGNEKNNRKKFTINNVFPKGVYIVIGVTDDYIYKEKFVAFE